MKYNTNIKRDFENAKRYEDFDEMKDACEQAVDAYEELADDIEDKAHEIEESLKDLLEDYENSKIKELFDDLFLKSCYGHGKY